MGLSIATCIWYSRGTLRVCLATQCNTLHKFLFQLLAITCESVWPGLYWVCLCLHNKKIFPSRPCSLVHFVSPIQIMWRYSGDLILCLVQEYMQTCSCLHVLFLMNTNDQISWVSSHDLYWENKMYKWKRSISLVNIWSPIRWINFFASFFFVETLITAITGIN